jgi:hypothetical protein
MVDYMKIHHIRLWVGCFAVVAVAAGLSSLLGYYPVRSREVDSPNPRLGGPVAAEAVQAIQASGDTAHERRNAAPSVGSIPPKVQDWVTSLGFGCVKMTPTSMSQIVDCIGKGMDNARKTAESDPLAAEHRTLFLEDALIALEAGSYLGLVGCQDPWKFINDAQARFPAYTFMFHTSVEQASNEVAVVSVIKMEGRLAADAAERLRLRQLSRISVR